MKTIRIWLYFLLALVLCQGYVINSKSNIPESKTRQNESKITEKDLQGHWINTHYCTGRYSETNPGLAPDADEWTSSYTMHLVIKGDSIWSFEYPCKFLSVETFEIKNGDSIYYNHSKIASAKVVKNSRGIDFVSKDRYCSNNISKDSLDLSILKKLVNNTINYDCLTGKLTLITESYGNEDGSYYKYKFPVNLPAYINLPNIVDAKKMYQAKTVDILIDGVLYPFNVSKIETNVNSGSRYSYKYDKRDRDNDNYPKIFLKPGKWWAGFEFELEYSGFENPDTVTYTKMKRVVKSKYPVWIQKPKFREVKNLEMELVNEKLTQLGFMSDPNVLRQLHSMHKDDYEGWWDVIPVQSGKAVYYKIPLKRNKLLELTTDKKKQYDVDYIQERINKTDFAPVKKVKSITGFYFRKKEPLNAETRDVDDGVVEIWEFETNADALKAKTFFDANLNSGMFEYDVDKLGLCYDNAMYTVKNNYFICIYSEGYWDSKEVFGKFIEMYNAK